MVLSVSCTCCALVRASAACCGYLCYPTVAMRQWPLWSNPVPLSLIQCTCIVPLFLRCCVISYLVLIAQCGKVLRLPLRSYHLYNWISQFRFDTLKTLGWVRVMFFDDGYSKLTNCCFFPSFSISTAGRPSVLAVIWIGSKYMVSDNGGGTQCTIALHLPAPLYLWTDD